jgi:hypothetical protein
MTRVSLRAVNDVYFQGLETLAYGSLDVDRLRDHYGHLAVTVGHAQRAGCCKKGIDSYLRQVGQGRRQGMMVEILDTLGQSISEYGVRTIWQRYGDYIFLALLRAVAEEEGPYAHDMLQDHNFTIFQAGAFIQREAGSVRARLTRR